MNIPSYASPHESLLFKWERPRRRKAVIAGFLLGSVLLHAFCFYLFQVVYPPVISLSPPPARVSLIAPNSPEAQTFLNWLEAEDPAVASQTQRPADARAFQLPKLVHIPSYLAVPPQLKEPPPVSELPATPSAMPPGPVPMPQPAQPANVPVAPTRLIFSNELSGRPVSHPVLKFHASLRETPQSARFSFALDASGVIRYILIEQSSGDAALDDQARGYLVLTRFEMSESPAEKGLLTWATATFEFGSDLQLPSKPAERAP